MNRDYKHINSAILEFLHGHKIADSMEIADGINTDARLVLVSLEDLQQLGKIKLIPFPLDLAGPMKMSTNYTLREYKNPRPYGRGFLYIILSLNAVQQPLNKT